MLCCNKLGATLYWLKDLLFEEFQVVEAWLQFALLDVVDDLHHGVVHRCRETDLPSVFGYGSVDGVYFGELAFLQVLEHAGLELCVLLDGDRDDEERDRLLDAAFVVEQLDDVLALDRLYSDASDSAYVDALLYDRLDDAA